MRDGLPIAGNVTGARVSKGSTQSSISTSPGGGGIEAARTEAQRKVKTLEVQIQEATNAGSSSLYFASQLAS